MVLVEVLMEMSECSVKKREISITQTNEFKGTERDRLKSQIVFSRGAGMEQW